MPGKFNNNPRTPEDENVLREYAETYYLQFERGVKALMSEFPELSADEAREILSDAIAMFGPEEE